MQPSVGWLDYSQTLGGDPSPSNNHYLIKHAVVVQIVRRDNALKLSLRQVLALYRQGEEISCYSVHLAQSQYQSHHHACKRVSELCSIQRLVSVRVEHLEDLSNDPKYLSTTIVMSRSQSLNGSCLDAVTWSGGSVSKYCLMKERTSACTWSIGAAAVDLCAGRASAQGM